MWVRISRLQAAPGRLESLIDEFTGNVAPKLRALPGNAGAILLVDRQENRANAISYWRDRESLDGSETAATGLRTSTASNQGATIEGVERGELLLMERSAPPQAGQAVRALQFSVDPAQVDAGVAYMRSEGLPDLQRQEGFVALIVGANREAGLGFMSTVWATAAARDASFTALADRRNEALQRFGAANLRIQAMESVYVDIAAPTLT